MTKSIFFLWCNFFTLSCHWPWQFTDRLQMGVWEPMQALWTVPVASCTCENNVTLSACRVAPNLTFSALAWFPQLVNWDLSNSPTPRRGELLPTACSQRSLELCCSFLFVLLAGTERWQRFCSALPPRPLQGQVSGQGCAMAEENKRFLGSFSK